MSLSRTAPVSLLLAALAAGPAQAQAPPTAREAMIARTNAALVRIVAVGGAEARWVVPDDRARAPGPDAMISSSFGTGLAVRPHVVLTARHVIAGSQFVLVLQSGSSQGVAARVVYADAVADIAFLAVDEELAHVVALDAHPAAARPGASLWVSGFPVDPTETSAAVSPATFSRVTADGLFELSAPVNPGNSGGPLFDEGGTVLGVVVSRGSLARGIEGVARAEPIGLAVEALAGPVAAAPERPFTPVERELAHVHALQVTRAEPTAPIPVDALLAAVEETTPPAERLIAAIDAWVVLRSRLATARTNDIGALPAGQRGAAQTLCAHSVELASRALRDAPYLASRYPFAVMLLRTNGSPAELARLVPHPDPATR